MSRLYWAPALLLLAAATAAADDVRSKPLTLHPPAPAARALRYALLPEVGDTTPGNAVDHYHMAAMNMKQDAPPTRDWHPMLDQWMAAPLKDLPRKDVGEFLQRCESTFKEVDIGARCEQFDWRLTERLRKAGFNTMVQDFQDMRDVTALLSLRIRYELAEGRTDEAARSLQTGFAMARHTGDSPTLITALVGIAIGNIMLDRLEEVIQQRDAPSFYWPLADLPRPMFDLRKPMQGERVAVYATFPGMADMAADVNAKPWTPEQVEKIVVMFRDLDDEQNQVLKVKNEALMLSRLATGHEAAKKALIGEGRPKELVDAMPHVQVAMRAALQHYDAVYDEMLKWQNLPYAEALPGMQRAAEKIKQDQDDANGPAIQLARLLLPRADRVLAARTRIDRRVAALHCVEAVRLHAAAHDGKLPASLDEIHEAPIPADPADGKPFGYRVVGDRAFFSSTPFLGQPVNNANTPTYELVFNR
jgi:hypothetical protein